MKLLVVSNMYPTQERPVGGIFVHEQVKALRAAGIDVRVAAGRPLWLPATNARWALGLVRRELRERRQPFAWRQHEGVPVLDFSYFAGAFAQPWLYPWIYRHALKARLPQIAREFPYEFVHTHTAFLDGRAGSLAASGRNVPMILTEHTGPFSLVTRHPLFRLHTLAGLEAAQRVIAVSAALAADIRRELPAFASRRIDVVPNGVDTAFFDPDRPEADAANPSASAGTSQNQDDAWVRALALAKRDLNLSGFILGLREGLVQLGDAPLTGRKVADVIETALLTGLGEGPFQAAMQAADLPATVPPPTGWEAGETGIITVLWVGHLERVKRVDRLLDAFAIAVRHRPQLRLRLVGGGELEAPLHARANSLRLGTAVAFLPSKDRVGVREEMRHADFLVISSETETFGVVGIEAQAMGLPVLATDCGGPAEYVTAPRDGERVGLSAEDIAIGLQRMVDRLDGFDRAAIRDQAVERFDFKRVAERLIGIYENVLDQHSAAAR